MKNNEFIKLLKKYTSIHPDFINAFLEKFTIHGEHEFHLDEVDIANYLNILVRTLRKRLNGSYTDDLKNKEYIENDDYIRIKQKDNKIKYMLNYVCFEKLAMNGNTEASRLVRNYFVILRKFLFENRRLIYQTINQHELIAKTIGKHTIYFFVVDKRYPNILKLGATSNIIKRLQKYNTGRIKDIELKYLAIVSNKELIETCVKNKLVPYQYIKNREIFEVSAESIKKIITKCYKKFTSDDKHAAIAEELSTIFGLYGYIKDKVNIKPFVVIDN